MRLYISVRGKILYDPSRIFDFDGVTHITYACSRFPTVEFRLRLLPLRFLESLVAVPLHKPGEIGRNVEVLRHRVQHIQLFKVGVAHRAKEFVLLPDRIGHGAGSLAGGRASGSVWGGAEVENEGTAHAIEEEQCPQN